MVINDHKRKETNIIELQVGHHFKCGQLKMVTIIPKKQQEMNIINMLVAISSWQALLCECYMQHLQHHQQ